MCYVLCVMCYVLCVMCYVLCGVWCVVCDVWCVRSGVRPISCRGLFLLFCCRLGSRKVLLCSVRWWRLCHVCRVEFIWQRIGS